MLRASLELEMQHRCKTGATKRVFHCEAARCCQPCGKPNLRSSAVSKRFTLCCPTLASDVRNKTVLARSFFEAFLEQTAKPAAKRHLENLKKSLEKFRLANPNFFYFHVPLAATHIRHCASENLVCKHSWSFRPTWNVSKNPPDPLLGVLL